MEPANRSDAIIEVRNFTAAFGDRVILQDISFDVQRGEIFVILGGVGRLFGPVAGAALYVLMEHVLGGLTEYWQLPLGLVLLGVVLFARGGLVGMVAGGARHD